MPGSQGLSPTYEQAHRGLDLLTLASMYDMIKEKRRQALKKEEKGVLFIKNVHLVDPASGTDGIRDILTDNGKIAAIGEHLPLPDGDCAVIDGSGLTAAPGLVDVHIHFRDPGATYKEDIHTGAKAAAAGGVTSVVLMANTTPRVDNVDTLHYIIEKGKETGIHVYTCANVTEGMKGEKLVDMSLLKAEGAVGFTDDGMPLLDEKIAKQAMEAVAALDMPISFHEENPAYIQNNGVNAGRASQHYDIGGSDRMAEIDMVKRDVELALKTGASIVVQHISTKEAVELVRQGKKRGGKIHAEAAPHHFTLTEEAVIQYGTLAKMNPPLREEADRLAIIKGLTDGTIDMIATDHAPHSKEEKEKPITEAPSGIIGLETSLALSLEQLWAPGYLTMSQLIERMSLAPAKLYKLDAGYVAEGGPADLVLFDPEEEWTPEKFASRSQNSPFLGKTLKGKVKYTICAGNVVYSEQ